MGARGCLGRVLLRDSSFGSRVAPVGTLAWLDVALPPKLRRAGSARRLHGALCSHIGDHLSQLSQHATASLR